MCLFSVAKFNTLRFEVEELYRGIFDIDPVTGEVFVPKGNKDRLDYEKISNYDIQITVKDRCDTGTCYGKFRGEIFCGCPVARVTANFMLTPVI
jgi:hypothetical protein